MMQLQTVKHEQICQATGYSAYWSMPTNLRSDFDSIQENPGVPGAQLDT